MSHHDGVRYMYLNGGRMFCTLNSTNQNDVPDGSLDIRDAHEHRYVTYWLCLQVFRQQRLHLRRSLQRLGL